MRVINSVDVPKLLADHELSEEGKLWVYNAYDCTTTHEIEEVLEGHDDELSRQTYAFSRAQQGPALTMMRRGCKIDMLERERLDASLTRRMDRVQANLNRLAFAWWGKGLNPLSPHQHKDFFYGSMKIKEIRKRDKFTGDQKATVNDEALERIAADYFLAEPFVKLILKYKELQSKRKVIRSGVDDDGRLRCSFNVGATETGRWSSSKNCFGRGTNGQNITPEMRTIFIPDDGMVLGYADLQQAESRGVGYLSGDDAYIDACESGDLHTKVCQQIWPTRLPWTGDIAKDKELCDSQMFDALHSFRFMSKSNGHATNYYASAHGLAQRLGIELSSAQRFQLDYFTTFNRIPLWHQYIAQELQTKQFIITPLGRRRHFFGRLNDDHTLREAIAFVPQSLIADILNLGLMRVWRELDLPGHLQILFQIHDAILFQFPIGSMWVLDRIRDLMTFPVLVNDRLMTIPVEIKIGYDWAHLVSPTKLASIQPRSQNFLDRAIL